MADIGVDIALDVDISGMDDKELIAVLIKQPEIVAAKRQLAQEAVTYAKSIAPVADEAHTTKGGYVDKPGSYRDSIHVEVAATGGVMVVASDFKAHWIEYGTETMPEQAVMRRTEEEINGRT